MIKVVSLLHRKAFAEGLLIPDMKNAGHNSGEEGERLGDSLLGFVSLTFTVG
jgi:hypothetical protein